MNYLKLDTMEYPLHEGDIRLLHPEILESQTGSNFPLPLGYVEVKYVPPPLQTATHIADSAVPVFKGKEWVLSWNLRFITDEDRRDISINMPTEENTKINQLLEMADVYIKSTPPPDDQIWRTWKEDLEAYRTSYPRVGGIPKMPRMDENGNVLTVNDSGSAPNVIG